MLLEPTGVVDQQDGATVVNVCAKCLKDLESDMDKPPALLLANNLWIGQILWELQVLTVPEQLLITLVHPHIYVFKLYPKDKDFRLHSSTLQHGMQGNVCTYAQDIEGVANMLEGRLLPHPLQVLSSIVMITYIGKGQLPKVSLHATFWVR